jgi:hypothetical protein
MAVPRIDHVVVDVGDGIDEAARQYLALGFQLTARGHHSLGSSNRLCMFGSEYIELLSRGTRPDLAGFPIGLNGLVFAMEAAEALHDEQRNRGVPVQAVLRFSRTVDLVDGYRGEARFNVVRLEPQTVFDGRVYFCEHLTPELIWRREWQAHPNGAVALARIALSVGDPNKVADVFNRMFGAGVVAPATGQDGPHVLPAGKVPVELWPRELLARSLGDAMPYPAGRADYMALLGVRVRSLCGTWETLKANGIHNTRVEPGRILVPPARAMNVALEFIE